MQPSTRRPHPISIRPALLPLLAGLLLTAALLPLATSEAQDAAQQAAIARGGKTFAVYCASCHGADARGEGPMTPALRYPPRDLTLLEKKNDGVFPAERTMKVIDGSEKVVGHGSTEMPVWGPIFTAQHEGGDARTPESRIEELVAYLESIQRDAAGG